MRDPARSSRKKLNVPPIRVHTDAWQTGVAIFVIIDATSPPTLTLCVNDIAICIDSLVNRLRGDMHLGVMRVPTKPFFDWGVILGATPVAALHSHLSTMTARRRHHHILLLNLHRWSPCPPSTSTDPLFNRGAFPPALQAANAINGRRSSSRR